MTDTSEFQDWPRCGYNNTAFECSEERPMPKGAPGSWRHSRTQEVGEQQDGWPGGDIVKIECLNCGHRWKTELPQ